MKKITNKDVMRFQAIIRRYYRVHGRELPWRNTRDPYRILISECMLQQTQVSRVLIKYKEFLKEFPTLRALADASPRQVLKAWQGLGYNRRALSLHALANEVRVTHKGILPHDREALLALPGIGQSTAGALLAFAFGEGVP